MKKLLFLLFIITSLDTFAQKAITVSELKSPNLKSILCSVDTVIYKSNNSLSVILYQVSNASGTAHLHESDEVSNKFLFAVSSIDDSPERHLYSVGNFIYPKIFQFESLPNNHYRLVIEYGIITNRKKVAYIISLKKISKTSAL